LYGWFRSGTWPGKGGIIAILDFNKEILTKIKENDEKSKNWGWGGCVWVGPLS
jgi:hypothetical protein